MAEHSGSDVLKIEKPSKPALRLLKDNEVEVNWITPKASGICILEFEIEYKESSKKQKRTVNQKAGENRTVIPGLKKNTKYEFKLRALNFDEDECSDWSEITEILIDRKADSNRRSSDEEEYYDAAEGDRETDNVASGVKNIKLSISTSNEILYERKEDDHIKEENVECAPIAIESKGKDDFSVDDTKPSIPMCIKKDGSHSLTLVWQKPSAYKKHIDCYEVFCKEETNKLYTVRTNHDGIMYKVDKLKQNCKYKCRVRAVTKTDYADEFGDLSVESKEITTNVTIASHLIRDDSTIEMRKDDYTNMALYKLKCFQEGDIDTQNKIRQVIVGRGRDMGDGVDKRYVLLFGKAGAGKSTIIDLMVNHVYDVGWEDDFRLTAIDNMPDEIGRKEHLSQTQWITCYEMKRKENSMLPYDLVLIDTPGFQRDNVVEIESLKVRFKALFESGRLPGLHAICFVNQSHSGRLTSTEMSLSQTLSELFGQKITQNIFIFATCADSSNPMFTRIMKMIGFQYHESFTFSNTPFTIEHQMSRSRVQEMDWEKGRNEIFAFFNILRKLHLSSFGSFKVNAQSCEQIKLRYDAKREEISNSCYSLINILNKTVVYVNIKALNTDNTYSTICNACKRNCCSPCLASRIHKRLCWNIHLFSGRCIPCAETRKENAATCTLRDHEYGKNIFIHIPRLVSQLAGTERVDSCILFIEREQIRSHGLHLSKLLKEATKLQNEMQILTKLGEKYSKLDMIESFIKEKASGKSLDWELFVAIFEKCKKELGLTKNDRWKNLEDLIQM